MAVNLKNLDLNLLVVFEAIYSTGNISNAAKQLAMSQPAVSNSLARLRDLMGDQLFVRAKRGVEATSRAQQMIGPVREALSLIGSQMDRRKTIDLATYKRLFRVMVVDPLEPIIMPPVLNLIAEMAPNIAIENIAVRANYVEDIVSGTLDLACFGFPVHAAGIVIAPVCPVEAVVIARRNHPGIHGTLDVETYLSLGHVTLTADLKAQTHVERDLVAAGGTRRVVYMVGKMWSIPAMVARTNLIGMLPRQFAEEVADGFGLDIHEAPIKISDQYAYMMWHERNNDEAGHRWLRELLLTTMRENFESRPKVRPRAPAPALPENNETHPKRRRAG